MNWRDIGPVPFVTWRAVLTSVTAPTELSSEECWRAAGEHSALCLAQILIESSGGRSKLAASWFNCLGQRPRPDDTGPTVNTESGQFRRFTSFAQCIRYWYSKITDPTYHYADTVTLEDYIHVYAPASDNNNEATYVRDVTTYVESWPREEEDHPMPATFTTAIPGLPGGPLVTDYPIKISLIPAGNTRQRPGTKAHTPRRSVQHQTGNPNSLAASDANWILGGADGAQLSVHFETDDTEVWMLVPADEVSWQAADGGGPGNMNGLSCELTQNAAVWANTARRDRAIFIAADLMGRCAARLNIAIPEQHWTFNFALTPSQRHDCPQLLRHVMIGGKTAWDALYVTQWNASKADELTRMGGTPTPVTTAAPAPQYAKPFPPEPLPAVPHAVAGGMFAIWLPLTPKRWKALKEVKRRQFAKTDAPEVGPPIKKGEAASFEYSVAVEGGSLWFVSKNGSRCLAEAFVPEAA